MSETCNQSCNSCAAKCNEKEERNMELIEKTHELSQIKKVIGVISGKGGVGKSLVTSMLAVEMNKRGYRCAVLDADITGPSIPKVFGINGKAFTNEMGTYPVKSKKGIDVMSINLLLENHTDPVVWRGPIIAGTVKQFWTEIIWGDIDYMFIDMPPGTGDVPLTVFQSIPVDEIVIVSSPQSLVSDIVSKAVKMAAMMNMPVMGLVENMSYLKCPDCDKEIKLFGESNIDEIANKYNLKVLAKLPIDPAIAAACDRGDIEDYEGDMLGAIADSLEGMDNTKGEVKMTKIAVASEKENVTGHFGHCENFNVFEVENGKIIKFESVGNPGHKPGFLPNFLHDLGVNIIISGGMGSGAVDIFNEKGIQVVTGANGNAKEAVEKFVSGSLVSTNVICTDHNHE
jgi:Mrp family chromosome partitioning ATPase/predicted Fe-Mo cluster-binding NifX family protein